ncbi:ribosomal protein S18 acetylase RimI-like enzyme [Geodermatophilus bullaregiensis]|uniref:GNAT family N-acetyltransferase n=1 Tax=Geodermatophilus bullaregiensis TaxID=1564160 RepID=UPI00195B3BDA|nr:GNAT family N-acetyltransferase [Geodermatophilus bullaregiensis]MBM7805726.1 ribosomal protein S18 acetylase RimI-like enzyme [Geodermatophilus bullaregiensis]
MAVEIRDLTDADLPAVVALSLRAWAPVFASFEAVLGPAVYRQLYPDWRTAQAAAVERVLRDPAVEVLVAADDGRPVGFVAVVVHDEAHDEPGSGEVEMLAVDPAAQRRGTGTRLLEAGLAVLRDAGVRLAAIGTGGDPGHAPARRTYEAAGFTALPLVRYYRLL